MFGNGWFGAGLQRVSGQVPSFHMHESCRCCCNSVSKLRSSRWGMVGFFWGWFLEVLGCWCFQLGGKDVLGKSSVFFSRFLSRGLFFFGRRERFPPRKTKECPLKIDVVGSDDEHFLLKLLMEEILHQLVGSFSHYLQGFIDPRWLAGFQPSTETFLNLGVSSFPMDP